MKMATISERSLLAGILLIALLCSGCWLVVGGAAGGGAAVYVMGKLGATKRTP